jgi:hypothetical protein
MSPSQKGWDDIHEEEEEIDYYLTTLMHKTLIITPGAT